MTYLAWLRTTTKTPSRRGARLTRCRDCKAPILTGLDNDQAAFTARTNPNPLDRIGEMLAVLAGLDTYELRQHAGTLTLWRRTARSIRARPPGTADLLPHRRYDVVAEHRCHTPPLPTIPSAHQPDRKADSDACPY